MSKKPHSALRWTTLLAAGVMLGLVVAAAVVLLVAATGGVLTTPPGAWVTRLQPLPGIAIRISVPGLLRFATSPLALRLLDGRELATRAGVLKLSREGNTLQVGCAPCLLYEPRLAVQPVRIEQAQLRLTQTSAQTLAGELNSGAVLVRFTARLQPERIDIDWQLPSTAIAALYEVLGAAIPEAYLARIDGRIDAHGSVRLPQQRLQIKVALSDFAVAGLGADKLADGAIDFACRDANGRPHTRRVLAGEGRWISPAQSGALLAAAVLAAEDQRFYEHAGFDSEEIAQVLAQIDEQGVRRGASTISQQLARLLFTGADRTGTRKLRELLYAVEMERELDKRTILALYLNTVDWGPGICGADAAAQAYFGKRPYQLTPIEAAWLAGILRNPSQAHAQQFLARQADTSRAQWILQNMRTLPRREREHWSRQPLAFSAPDPAPVRAAQLAAAP